MWHNKTLFDLGLSDNETVTMIQHCVTIGDHSFKRLRSLFIQIISDQSPKVSFSIIHLNPKSELASLEELAHGC